MKTLASTLLLLLVTGSFADASTKVCFGSKQDEETKGVVWTAEISEQAITLKTIKTAGRDFQNYDGTYPTYGTTVKAHSGKVYLEYEGNYGDQQDVIMVDQELLKEGTTGLLQIRSRGEGYFNSVFVCKDDQYQSK